MIHFQFSLYTFEYFLMIFVRIASFIVTAPFFSMNSTPRRVKAGFAVFTSILVYQMIVVKYPLEYTGTLDYAVLVLREGITGLLIGFAANICNSIIMFAGKMIDMDIGLAMAQVFDPITHSVAGITGNLYNYFIMLLLIVTNMHHYLFRAIVDTYEIIPIGQTVFRWEHLSASMVKFMGDSMIIGFRIALPVFACIMILNCILGILAKVAPQLNMFTVGMQLKVLVGLTVMYLTVILLPDVANFIFIEMKTMMVSFIEGMR